MLENILNSYKEVANILPNWQKINKNELANLYLDNRNKDIGNVYAAALICRYWYKIGLIWKNNNSAMTQEDCYWIVWDGIERAINYAAWRNPENSLYNDPVGPDKAINICIETMRKMYYGFSNRDKRKLNHKSNLSSLDELYDLTKDYSTNLFNDSEVLSDTSFNDLFLILYIKSLIINNKLPEAIIIDNICFNDSTTSENGVTNFSKRKFISLLHLLDENYVKYFNKTYDVDEDIIRKCLNEINNLSGFKLHKLIDRTLYLARLENYK